MKREFRSSLVVVATAVGVAVGGVLWAADQSEDSAAKLARGRHIVEGVAMCHDCHTAMLPDGQPDTGNALMGATLPFRPTIDMPFAEVAPQVAGLPTMSDDEAVHFFMTGQRPGGVPPRPPMPRYMMARDEAEAVVAYLRSLARKE
jgi:mono/diheme cytochrome c family protein